MSSTKHLLAALYPMPFRQTLVQQKRIAPPARTLTITQVAKRFGVSRRSIDRYSQKGLLRRDPKTRLFNAAEIDADIKGVTKLIYQDLSELVNQLNRWDESGLS